MALTTSWHEKIDTWKLPDLLSQVNVTTQG